MTMREGFEPNQTADVVIVGGGVIGLAIARALVRRGMSDIMLIERGRPGAEASWAAGGILAPQIEADLPDDFFRLACAGRDMYPAFAAALQGEAGIDVELDTTGTLYLGFTEEDETELRHRHTWQTNAGLEVELLTGEEVRQLEPCISERVRSSLRFPNDIQVENRKLVEALIAANEKGGVNVAVDCEVSAILTDGNKVLGVETAHGFVSTPIVVVAAGAWTSSIGAPASHPRALSSSEILIEPVRGQMLCFKSDPPIARHVVYSSSGYLVPRRDGRLLAGSTAERVGFEKGVTAEGIASIKKMAIEIARVLEKLLPIDSWSGLRPRASDNLPVLGPSDQIGGLFYATGHYRNGILLAPITGELIADVIVNGVAPGLIAPFSPARFTRP